jgi:hypothetical protein
MMCLTIAYPSELETRLRVQVCGRPIRTWLSHDEAGRTVVGGFVPGDLTLADDGRLWVRLACLDDDGEPAAGVLSVARLSVSQESKIVVPLERLLAEKDALLGQQSLRISQLEPLPAEKDALLVRISQLEQSILEKDALLGRVTQLEQSLTEKDALLGRVTQLEQSLTEKDELLAQPVLQIGGLEQSLAEKDAFIGQQARRIGQRELRIGQLEQLLGQQVLRVSELEQVLQATYNSRSWKVTAPWRTMMTWLRR